MWKAIRNMIFLPIFICIPMMNIAQEISSYTYVDSSTLSQYLQHDWETLKKSTRQAIQNDIDYYYLRMRSGIAYYETRNYRTAHKHFRKALEYNNIDNLTYEYIYYSFLFSGRQRDANLFYSRHIDELHDKVARDTTHLEQISFDLLYNYSSASQSSFNVPFGTGGIQEIPQSFYGGNIFFVHDLSGRMRLTHGGTFLRKHGYYYYSDGNETLNYYNSVVQTQYYGSISLNAGSGFILNAGGHYIYSYIPAISNASYSFGRKSFLSNYSIYKNIGLFNFSVGIGFSNFNSGEQFQKNAGLEFYPLGNLNFYSVSHFYDVADRINNQSHRRQIFSQKLGFRISKSIWSESSVSTGEIRNMAIEEGSVIYNGYESIKNKGDLNLYFLIRRMTISLRGLYILHTDKFYDLQGLPSEINNINNKGLTIITGLKWEL